MRSKFASVLFSRRLYFLIFGLVLLAFQIGTFAQSQPQTSSFSWELPECPPMGMCITDPFTGRCMHVSCPNSVPTPTPTPVCVTGPCVFPPTLPTPTPTPACNTNVALASNGATAVASSTYVNGNYSPSGAIDGDRKGVNWGNGGGWNDNSRDVWPDWFRVDFNRSRRIHEIRVYTLQNDYFNPQEPTPEMIASDNGLQDFEVQTWNGSQWVTVPGGNVTGNDRVMRVFTFPDVTTTNIRIYVTNARNHFSRVIEVEAFGCTATPPTQVCLPLEQIDSCIQGPEGCLSVQGPPCVTPPVLQPPQGSVPLVISEFRLRGPGGVNDEFVELFNLSSTPVTVSTNDGSAGWSLVASDGIARFTIPVGTVIPGYAHYLAVNNLGYSLSDYPGGNSGGTTGDTFYIMDIPDRSGIALFSTSDPLNFNSANRIDAAGYDSAPALYREGAGFPGYAAEAMFNIEYSFYRDLSAGLPRDTNDNTADFMGVDANATNTGAGQHLGAPGPENLSSPMVAGSSKIQFSLLDPTVAHDLAPNRVRDTTPDPENNSPLGTLSIRRTLTNVSGANITCLRFRIVDTTTYPYMTGTSDIRAISSTAIVVTRSDGSNVFVNGTTLETPPAQLLGGGFNSTMSANNVTLSTPLAPGQSISLQFMLGVQQSGYFRFFVVVEALP
jgi:hypothetical protein